MIGSLLGSFIAFICVFPTCNDQEIPFFDSDSEDIHEARFPSIYFIENPQRTDAQFPGSQRIGTQLFPVSRFP